MVVLAVSLLFLAAGSPNWDAPDAFLESATVEPTFLDGTVPTSVAPLILASGAAVTSGNVLVPFVNPNGGVQGIRWIESASSANETLVTFANRSIPSRLKVCKVAGPGIPDQHVVYLYGDGFGATNAAPPQFATYGPVTRTFDVRAGDPAQGGTCEFVPGFGANAAWFQPVPNIRERNSDLHL
jgi:hypothetical protein